MSRPLVHRRHWTIESGVGAGLRLRVSHNLEYIRGTNELPVQQTIAANLQPGAVFYDVGANLGFFTLIAARLVGPAGQVCAFEPVSENVCLLRANARANGFTHVSAFETAVGAQTGTTELILAAWGGGATIEREASPPDATGTRRVPVVALDDAVSRWNLRPPDFVKIDVEGAEPAVLAGMRAVIRKHRPTVLVEVDAADSATCAERLGEVVRFFVAHGYAATDIPDSYPGAGWHVAHTLATPGPAAVRSV